jgi:sialate O-acetylesterase
MCHVTPIGIQMKSTTMSPRRHTIPFFLFAIAFASVCMAAETTLRPAKIFSNHMVLQQEMSIPVWGWAKPAAKVSIQFGGQRAEATADGKGRWAVKLKAIKANSKSQKMVIESGSERVTLEDVLVGEVWFAGGQSNMNYTASGMARKLSEGKSLVDAANHPAIRFCRISEPSAPAPKEDLVKSGRWDVCQTKTVVKHSAVCFVFARRLHVELKVPIGIIDCSWGGTPIEPYIPATAFTGHPTLEKLAEYAKSGDIEAIKKMRGGTYARSATWLAGAIYNSRIAPVKPYAIRGAIWYQAESNCGKGEDPRDYAHKMRALIKGWRTAFRQKDMPLYYVQLPQWKSYAWTYAREEQRRAMDSPNTGMAVTLDLDFQNDIHPPNKIDVGERLARWPLAKVYSKKIPFSGPLFKSAAVQGSAMVVTFDHADQGLMAGHILGVGKLEKAKDGKLNGFELVGSDGQWHAAQAIIHGEILRVSSSSVPKPLAVRYATHPTAPMDKPWNLYNKAGLPASPFCSDWARMAYDPAKNP